MKQNSKYKLSIAHPKTARNRFFAATNAAAKTPILPTDAKHPHDDQTHKFLFLLIYIQLRTFMMKLEYSHFNPLYIIYSLIYEWYVLGINTTHRYCV